MSNDQKKSNDNNYNGQNQMFKGNKNGKRKLRGPDINLSGILKNKALPIYCYKFGGWGTKCMRVLL